jgi:tetratricopeptide (TPR) repeat protein
MAGNKEAYQSYMEAGHNAVWEQNWQQATRAYMAAVREFPEDPEAHVGLGFALLRSSRLEEGLKVYQRAHQLSPDDPVPLEKSADILERMGRLKEAAQQYVKVSDIYLGIRDLDKAIGNWERATQLTPGLVSIHAKLAQAYERVGNKRQAIREYLVLAFNFRRMNDIDKAIKAVERALRLDRNNPQALNIMRALRSGGEVILPEDDEKPKAKARPRQEDDFQFEIMERESVGEANPLGPMGEAMEVALSNLASYVVESGNLDMSSASALQAMEYQRQGRYEEAVNAYQQAEKNLRHPALELNYGVLLVLQGQPVEAIKHLGEAMLDPNMASGAMHALGQAHYQTNRQKQASRYLIQSLQAVDSSLAINAEEEAELQSVYDRLYTALEETNDEAVSAINSRFLNLLSGKDWKQRIAETRRHLDEVMRSSGAGGARDFLTASGSDELTETVTRIDRYIRQALYTLAMDEAHRAVEVSPLYLPVHVRMAEIMMREGRVRQAINKYNTVARSYLVRDEKERAASILTEVLEMAPLDITVRQSLIELLETENRQEDVLDQYIQLARTYNQLGNFEMGRETFAIAERLGKKINASSDKMVLVKHQIAEMDRMRADTRRAQRVYEEIVELAPNDEKAYRALVDIYFGQSNAVEGIRKLDQLLEIYARGRQVNKILQVLQELVKQYPKDMGLRSRLAGIYVRLGRGGEAIENLDALGELQLEAGLHRDAVTTIRQIIRLKPTNINDYKRLLVQLGGGA